MTARSTPGSERETGTLLCRIAAPRKNEGKAITSATTNTSAAKTTHLAASIGSRAGTARSVDRIMPVEYSLVMTNTPRTQIVSWLS
jgi:hypothetical protein